jgi:hypothetical protein
MTGIMLSPGTLRVAGQELRPGRFEERVSLADRRPMVRNGWLSHSKHSGLKVLRRCYATNQDVKTPASFSPDSASGKSEEGTKWVLQQWCVAPSPLKGIQVPSVTLRLALCRDASRLLGSTFRELLLVNFDPVVRRWSQKPRLYVERKYCSVFRSRQLITPLSDESGE